MTNPKDTTLVAIFAREEAERTQTKLYVTGVEGRMRTFERPPSASEMRGPGKGTWYSWPGSGCMFPAHRGVVSEFKSMDRMHVYCREVPPELVEEIEEADKRVEEAKALVAKAMADRQLVLKAAAVRGNRVRADECLVWDSVTKTFVPPT